MTEANNNPGITPDAQTGTSTLAEDAKSLLDATATPANATAAKPPTPLATLAQTPAEPPLTLETAMVAARAGLGRALRALIAMGMADGDQIRNALENAYEAAKNEVTARTASLPTLEQAHVELKKAVAVLANDSRASKTDLNEVREAAATHAENLATLKAQAK